jgi:nucleotide-binding universal stress UspA family protein
MKVGKLLYVTNMSQPKFSEVERLADLRKLGFEEIIFLGATKDESWEGSMANYGFNSRIMMADGPLLVRILDVARQEAVSLIAASVNRDAGGLFRRSLTKDLLRSSPVPVMVLHEGAQQARPDQGSIFARVIFATDWSAASQKALGYLIGLKEVIGELEIVNVIGKKLSVRDMRNLKKKLAGIRKTFLDENIDAETHIYAGKPPEELILAAKDYGGTCIVMGTARRSTLKDVFSKSCSFRVAEDSVLPTLVIP